MLTFDKITTGSVKKFPASEIFLVASRAPVYGQDSLLAGAKPSITSVVTAFSCDWILNGMPISLDDGGDEDMYYTFDEYNCLDTATLTQQFVLRRDVPAWPETKEAYPGYLNQMFAELTRDVRIGIKRALRTQSKITAVETVPFSMPFHSVAMPLKDTAGTKSNRKARLGTYWSANQFMERVFDIVADSDTSPTHAEQVANYIAKNIAGPVDHAALLVVHRDPAAETYNQRPVSPSIDISEKIGKPRVYARSDSGTQMFITSRADRVEL